MCTRAAAAAAISRSMDITGTAVVSTVEATLRSNSKPLDRVPLPRSPSLPVSGKLIWSRQVTELIGSPHLSMAVEEKNGREATSEGSDYTSED